MKGTDLFNKWIVFAEEDYLSAKELFNRNIPVLHTICFLCHSSFEKYLKAFIVYRNQKIEKTHDLVKLVNICVEGEKGFSEFREYADVLNDYIIEGRYPTDFDIDSITKEDSINALNYVTELKTFIEKNCF